MIRTSALLIARAHTNNHTHTSTVRREASSSAPSNPAPKPKPPPFDNSPSLPLRLVRRDAAAAGRGALVAVVAASSSRFRPDSRPSASPGVILRVMALTRLLAAGAAVAHAPSLGEENAKRDPRWETRGDTLETSVPDQNKECSWCRNPLSRNPTINHNQRQ